MKNILLCVLLGAAAPPLTIGQDLPENARRAREEYSSLLHDPKRDPWQMPDNVVQSLAPKPNEIVLEVGDDGGGYFSRRIARTAQNVFVLNPSTALLQSVNAEAPPNQQTLAGPVSQVDFSFGIDTIFLYNTLGAFPSRQPYFLLASAILRPGGRIVVIDFKKQPPGAAQYTDATIIAEMAAAGLRLTQRFDYLPVQFFLVFQH
jgi:hypothetical protein